MVKKTLTRPGLKPMTSDVLTIYSNQPADTGKLGGLVVKTSALEAGGRWFESKPSRSLWGFFQASGEYTDHSVQIYVE